MARRGTPARIDLGELEKLCSLQCTDPEIAAWFNVSERTIERRRKQKKFADVMERGRAKGRISVRRMQMKLLEAGNATMGVWLGKNVLGQRDEVIYEVTGQQQYVCIMVPPGLSAAEEPAVTIDVGQPLAAIDIPDARE